MNYQVDPSIGEVATHLSNVNLTEVGSAMEQLTLAVSLDHWLVGLAVLDDSRLLVGRVDAQADRNRIAVQHLFTVSIDKIDA